MRWIDGMNRLWYWAKFWSLIDSKYVVSSATTWRTCGPRAACGPTATTAFPTRAGATARRVDGEADPDARGSGAARPCAAGCVEPGCPVPATSPLCGWCTPVATAPGCACNWLTCQAAIPAVPTRATVTTMAVIVMRWPDHIGRRLLPGAARRDAVAGAAPRIPSACGWPMGDTVSSQVGGEVTEVAPVPASEPARPAAVHGSATSWCVQGSRTSNPVVWLGPAAVSSAGSQDSGTPAAAGAATACSPGGDSATDTRPAGWASAAPRRSGALSNGPRSAAPRRSGALSNGPRSAGAGPAQDGTGCAGDETGCAGVTCVPQPAQ